MKQRRAISLSVNGHAYTEEVPVRLLLSDFLRGTLSLTGTHVGCEHGVCGCCTVLLDGLPVRSCLMFAVQAAGHDIDTVERLETARPCIRYRRRFARSTLCSAGSAPRASS